MDLLDQTIIFAKSKLASFDGGHDWLHTERVLKMAQNIQQREGVGDPEVVKLAAVLHDIADTKFHDGAETDGGNMAYDFLMSKGLDSLKAGHIRDIINNISFRKRMEQEAINTIEFQIVQDADRIDAMGAIGIARAFNYGGYKNRALYDPEIPVQQYTSAEAYRNSPAPTLNHFYEKLFLLKDLMNTATGRELALERHRYMAEFVKKFEEEAGLFRQ